MYCSGKSRMPHKKTVSFCCCYYLTTDCEHFSVSILFAHQYFSMVLGVQISFKKVVKALRPSSRKAYPSTQRIWNEISGS